MDLFRSVKERAQDVVAQAQHQIQQQQQKHAGAGSTTATSASASSSSTQLVGPGAKPAPPATGSSLPSLSALYTGGLPPLIRTGIASIDPRFEANRQSHLLSNALKALSIDHEATAREMRSAATATYKWGQDLAPPSTHSASTGGSGPSPRFDGSADPALVDITDRLAYVLTTIGDLEAAHVKRAEAARKEFKDIARAELELGPRRDKRVKIHKELLALVPERAKPSSAKRVNELESQLRALEAEDKAAEEAFAKLRRDKFQSSYSKYMDSLIELGEKMACAARHGKLLLTMVPTDQVPPFPASSITNPSTWEGAARTAQVRAALDPALHALAIDYKPATLAGGGNAAIASGSTTSGGPGVTGSYAESHAAQIAEAERTQAAVVQELSHAPPSSTISSTTAAGGSGDKAAVGSGALDVPGAVGGPLHRFDSNSSYGVSPGGAAAQPSPMAARLNMEPTPHLPLSPVPGANPTTNEDGATGGGPTSTGGGASGTSTALPVPVPGPGPGPGPGSPHAPPEDVTVAETGAAIFGTGGPKSGTLGVPRRKSTVPGASTIQAPSSSSSSTGLPTSSSSSSASASAAAASKSAEAAAERLAAEQAEVQAAAERERLSQRASLLSGQIAPVLPAVNARLRRDGTVVRRGEADWAAAESEDLPPYSVEDASGPGGGAGAGAGPGPLP